MTLGDLFKEEMDSLFKNVYSKNFVKKMYNFNLGKIRKEER